MKARMRKQSHNWFSWWYSYTGISKWGLSLRWSPLLFRPTVWQTLYRHQRPPADHIGSWGLWSYDNLHTFLYCTLGTKVYFFELAKHSFTLSFFHLLPALMSRFCISCIWQKFSREFFRYQLYPDTYQPKNKLFQYKNTLFQAGNTFRTTCFHDSPNKITSNNRTNSPQITENFQFSLVVCYHLWQLSSVLDSMPIKDKYLRKRLPALWSIAKTGVTPNALYYWALRVTVTAFFLIISLLCTSLSRVNER